MVHIAHQYDMAVPVHGAQEMVHQQQINHRDLVDDDEIHFKRVVFIALKDAIPGIVFKQAVDRLRRLSRALGNPFGGAPGRRCQGKAHLGASKDRKHGLEQRRLARSRPARDHQDLFVQRSLCCVNLICVELNERGTKQLGAHQINGTA